MTRLLILVGALGAVLGGCFAPEPKEDGEELVVLQPLVAEPAPIQGGTMAIDAAGELAVVADPERHRVSVVNLTTSAVTHIGLRQGDMPGRVVIDDDRAHIVLNGAGALATIDMHLGRVLLRRHVCAAPSGLAVDEATGLIHVACISGELVTMDATAERPERSVFVEPGLRDVLLHDGQIQVTKFKTADLLTLNSDGEVVGRRSPAVRTALTFDPLTGAERERTMEPAVAWRSLALEKGRVLMLHQRGQVDEIELGEEGHDGMTDPAEPQPEDLVPGAEESAYGGGACNSIVDSTMTMMDDTGEHTANPMGDVTLGVDAAVSPDGRSVVVAVAGAGHNDGDQMDPFSTGISDVNTMAMPMDVIMGPVDDLFATCNSPLFDDRVSVTKGAPVVAVGFDKDSNIVALTREPANLLIYPAYNPDVTCFDCDGILFDPDAVSATIKRISLGGASVASEGHDMFHRNAGAGIACASCHPGGGDDGRVWNFTELGPRRSQAVHIGLEGTEPFHWDGDMADLNMLVSEVFVRRMGGEPKSDPQVDSLGDFLFALQPPSAMRGAEELAVQRGQELFESTEVGCADCHSGAKLTNNEAYDVGTGKAFQVPSLVGIGYRAPFIHNGCADTLEERFDPDCGGGDMHGRTSQLAGGQIDDLVAYLNSL